MQVSLSVCLVRKCGIPDNAAQSCVWRAGAFQAWLFVPDIVNEKARYYASLARFALSVT